MRRKGQAAQDHDAMQPEKRRRPIREEFTNLPNLLTFARIAMIPPVVVLLLQDTPRTDLIAGVLFGLAAATDWLDGFLARRMGLESLLGRLLDPLADKLIVMASLVIAAQLGRIPGWFVVLLLSRELAITGLRSIASQEGLIIAVDETGKWKTALQLLGIFGVIVQHRYPVHFGFTEELVHFGNVGFALLAISMIFSLMSAFLYFWRFIRAIALQKAEER